MSGLTRQFEEDGRINIGSVLNILLETEEGEKEEHKAWDDVPGEELEHEEKE